MVERGLPLKIARQFNLSSAHYDNPTVEAPATIEIPQLTDSVRVEIGQEVFKPNNGFFCGLQQETESLLRKESFWERSFFKEKTCVYLPDPKRPLVFYGQPTQMLFQPVFLVSLNKNEGSACGQKSIESSGGR